MFLLSTVAPFLLIISSPTLSYSFFFLVSSIQKKISPRRVAGFCKVIFAVDCKGRSPQYYWKQFHPISRDHKNINLRWHILSQFCTSCISKLKNTRIKAWYVNVAADKERVRIILVCVHIHPSPPRMYMSVHNYTKRESLQDNGGRTSTCVRTRLCLDAHTYSHGFSTWRTGLQFLFSNCHDDNQF